MPQLHPSSLDFNKERFGERCHVHLRGHKKTLWTPAKTVEKRETSLIQVRRAFWWRILKFIVNILQDTAACLVTVPTETEDSA